jgi:protein-export membrane protein SecD
VRNEDVPAVQGTLATPGIDSILTADTEVLLGAESDSRAQGGGRPLYVLKRTAEMTGGSIASASAQVGLDQTNPGAWGVQRADDAQGSRRLRARLGRQRRPVSSPSCSTAWCRRRPFIRDRITGGNASITGGSFDVNTAKDIAIVLRAGALPRAVKVLEERTVGPSLGADSIHEGITAGLIGTAMVVGFMAIYYQLSGLIAIAALLLNLLYLIAAMAAVGATLTLPGLAGIVLTVGMAVDTNVLIFERIREEMRSGEGHPRVGPSGLRPRVPHHLRRALDDADLGAVPVPVRHRPHQGLRRDAQHRPSGQPVHRRGVHADDL